MLKKLFVIAVVGATVLFGSCKKDSKDGNGLDYNYNDKSVAQNKATMEDNGIQLVDEMQAMTDLQSAEVVANLANLTSDNGGMMSSKVLQKLAPLSIMKSAKAGKLSSKGIETTLKSTVEDPTNLEEAWAQVVGTYDYNFTTDDFDYVAGGNSVEINFPGLETDLTNTAQITVDNFNYISITEDPFTGEVEDFGGQLPSSIDMELSYNGDALITWDFTATYLANGMPTSFSTILTVEEFEYSIVLTHSPYTTASATSSFKHSGNVLIEGHVDGSGNWSEDNIDNNTETTWDVYSYDYYDEYGNIVTYYDSTEYFQVNVENILTSANAYMQVMDIKVAGQVNINALATKMKALDESWDNEEITEQEYTEESAKALNENAELVVISVSENAMLAKAEAYALEVEDEWGNYWTVDMRFVFADGSPVDAETYFGEGFEDLYDDINAFIIEVNASYDTTIEIIE